MGASSAPGGGGVEGVAGPTLSLPTRHLHLGLCGVRVGGEGELALTKDGDVPARVRATLQGCAAVTLEGSGETLVPPRGVLPLRVSYLPTLPTHGEEDKGEVVVDVEGVGEKVLVAAVTASACTPPLRLSSSALTLRPHIHHSHTCEVQLCNDSAIPIRVDVLTPLSSSSSDPLEVAPFSLLLPPHSASTLRVTVTPLALSPREVTVLLLLSSLVHHERLRGE